MITPTSTPIPNPNIIGRVIDDEVVLVLPDQGKIKVLNEVGAAIWNLIDGKRNVQQISAEICNQFDVDLSVIETDAVQFITELSERGIITTL